MTDDGCGIRRSWLFVPSDNVRRSRKAFECGADAVILDLEDAVAVGRKGAAREAVVPMLAAVQESHAFVRVNGVHTRWCYADLLAIVRPGLKGIVVPKVEQVCELQIVDWFVRQLELERGLELGSVEFLPMVETAIGISTVDAIAGCCPRTTYLGFGVADYSLDLGLIPAANEVELAHGRSSIVHAARTAGIHGTVDGVVVEFRDPHRFQESAERGRQFGLSGKFCIHPDQVPIANEVFSPTEAELKQAMAVVTAFEAAESAGTATATVDDSFVDYPVVMRARRILALADRLTGPSAIPSKRPHK